MTPNFKKGFDTICIKDDTSYSSIAHTTPIFASSTYVYESPEKAMEVFRGNEEAFIYGRWNHPNVELVENKLTALESFGIENLEAKGYLFSTGMAAIAALFNSTLSAGGTIIAQGNIYGTTVELLNTLVKNRGVQIVFADFADIDNLKKFAQTEKNIQLFYAETPSNPTISAYDLEVISAIAHSCGAKMAVDNTFATPYLQQPFAQGVDFIAHSTTKFLNGHGTALGGFLIGRDKNFMQQEVWKQRKLQGAMLSPFDAWLLNQGLKTLSIRMDKHCNNAREVAVFLRNHQAINKVNYLGFEDHPHHTIAKKQMREFGGVISFELKAGLEAGIKLMNQVKLCTLTASLGTADTLIQHPASMTHFNVPKEQREKFGITDGLIRLSVGMENIEDIIGDLEMGLK